MSLGRREPMVLILPLCANAEDKNILLATTYNMIGSQRKVQVDLTAKICKRLTSEGGERIHNREIYKIISN